jgi:hypothetical protein
VNPGDHGRRPAVLDAREVAQALDLQANVFLDQQPQLGLARQRLRGGDAVHRFLGAAADEQPVGNVVRRNAFLECRDAAALVVATLLSVMMCSETRESEQPIHRILGRCACDSEW